MSRVNGKAEIFNFGVTENPAIYEFATRTWQAQCHSKSETELSESVFWSRQVCDEFVETEQCGLSALSCSINLRHASA